MCAAEVHECATDLDADHMGREVRLVRTCTRRHDAPHRTRIDVGAALVSDDDRLVLVGSDVTHT